MRVLIALLLMTVPAFAETDAKGCIHAAAELLPHIPGLTIDQSNTRPIPHDLAVKWTATPDVPIIVDLRITAAEQRATFTYMCAMIGGQPRAQRIVE